MKKLFTLILTLCTLSILSACQTTSTKQSSETSASSETVAKKATFTLQEDGKDFLTKEVKVKEGATVYDALSAAFPIKAEKGFITEINGHSQDEKASKYWLYTINGKMAEKGATETPLKAGDKVVFNLQVIQ